MAFAKRRRTAVVVRKPVTQNPRFIRLAARVNNSQKRVRVAAARNEQTFLVLAGAAAPALITRLSGKSLPTIAGIDPSILFGGVLIAAGMYTAGKNGERMKSFGLGLAAPGISRAVQTGTIKVSGDDVGADDDISGDDDVGEDI
jgi:hypothetical protein